MTRKERYEKHLSKLQSLIKKDYGDPCETKDTEDFPDIVGDPNAGRCPVCIVYEKLKELTNELDLDY